MSIFKGIDVIRRWVIQTVLKDRGKQGGVTITLPRKKFCRFKHKLSLQKD